FAASLTAYQAPPTSSVIAPSVVPGAGLITQAITKPDAHFVARPAAPANRHGASFLATLFGVLLIAILIVTSFFINGTARRPGAPETGGTHSTTTPQTIPSPTSTGATATAATPSSPVTTIQFAQYSMPAEFAITNIINGTQGSIWVTGASITHITPTSNGDISAISYTLPNGTLSPSPTIIFSTLGPDQNLWFVTYSHVGYVSQNGGNSAAAGQVITFAIP